MSAEPPKPVSVEDLLRVKRAERPRAEFWSEFDRELRTKQLAALVERRPWWKRSPQLSFGWLRYGVPVGAAAAIAVTLVSFRQDDVASPDFLAPTGAASSVVAVAQSHATSFAHATGAPAQAGAAAVAESSQAGPGHSDESDAAPALGAEDRSLVAHETSRLLRGVDFPAHAVMVADETAAIEVPFSNAMLTTSAFEARALPARSAPSEPLAQMPNPAETRRSRFASAFAAATATSVSTPAPATRVARRLSDEQLYDSIHRFGASGNSVSIRF